MANAAHIKPLTSLRFFAALWVVVFHYWPHLAVAGDMPALVAKGYLGVELFFVLSGFILCHVYLPQVEEGRFHYGDFLWARLARIYPMHLVTLIAMGLMAGGALAIGLAVDPNVLSFASLPANLTLTQAWGLAPTSGWNHPSWSISAEWFAYLSFPAFAALTLSLRRWPGVAVAAALALVAVLYPAFQAIAGFPLTKATTAWGALRIVPCFALGCALYLAWRNSVADSRKALAGACFFTIAVIAAAALRAPDALIVSGFGGLIITLAQVSKSGSQRFSHPFFVYLGEISYSVYMVCIPWEVLFVNVAVKIGHFSGKQLPPLLWLVFLVTLVPLAAMTHHLIEKPARERVKLWRRSRTPHDFATATAR
ncbi:MAG TPA: acyltransferase [Caulobacteraceae bacterium]|nr:acyltransferase [Caulobacteraceae bacterium]